MKLKCDPLQIRLSGTGGQGLILAGVILAEAAIRDGYYVVQTQSYGPEARLGASRAELIISAREIAYPQVNAPDLVLCLSAESFEKFGKKTSRDSTVFVDTGALSGETASGGTVKILALPILETAKRLGGKQAANVVALGMINAELGLVCPESLSAAVADRVPIKFRQLNQAALEAGISLITSRQAPEELQLEEV